MSQERIALLTYKDEPKLTDSEQQLPFAFAKEGILAEATPWDGNINWNDYQTLILRACWNYHLNKDKFIEFLEKQAGDGKKIWNSLENIKWNTDKHYLLDLEKKGVKIIPTVILEPENNQTLLEILTVNNWLNGIVKPTVGASAYNVQKFNIETARDIESGLDRKQPWIIQKFCPEINQEGEYSLMFFNKKYSHAVMKKPKTDDFRTQPHYGGIEWEVEADKKIIEQAKTVLEKVEGKLLYARVDGVVVNGEFQLMELELTEPYLFLGSHPEAPQRFVKAYIELAK